MQREKPFPQLSGGAVLCGLWGEVTTLGMGWCDEALGFPDPSGGEDSACPPQTKIDARLAGFPVENLVRAWRESSATSLKDQTAGTHAFRMYFNEKFRHLLGGVWFHGMSPRVAERLEQARDEVRW